MHATKLCGVVLSIALFTGAARSATYTVTNPGDAATGGTLRWAINAANTNPGSDAIAFNLSVLNIAPTGALPMVSDLEGPLTIDGTTQPGYAGTPIVRLTGTNAPAAAGLALSSRSNVVRGLILTRFQAAAVAIFSGYNVVAGCQIVSNVAEGVSISGYWNTIGGTNAADGNLISRNSYGVYINGDTAAFNAVLGNRIGTDVAGTSALGNVNDGILVAGPSNRIGSAAAGGGNTCSANGSGGVALIGAYAYGNRVEGNRLGVRVSGTAALPNVSGLRLYNASSNTVGGTDAGAGNVLSGNSNTGVDFGGTCRGNVVLGNLIGTDATGESYLGNELYGVYLPDTCTGNRIGGDSAAGRNVISGNDFRGVFLDGCTGNVISANLVGLSASGAALGNGIVGILLSRCAQVVVGGTNEAAGNTIGGNPYGVQVASSASNTIRFNRVGLNGAGVAVGNSQDGILLDTSVAHTIADNTISGNGAVGLNLVDASRCTVVRNLIGTDPTGSAARPNGNGGIRISTAAGVSASNVIGGTLVAEGNTISGNAGPGLTIQGIAAAGQTVKGNRIGTDLTGTAAVPNESAGIDVVGSPFNLIGSTNAAERNVISGNHGAGISLSTTNARGNLILGNTIGFDAAGTGELGDLAGSGVAIIQGAWSNTVGGFTAGAANRIGWNAGTGVWIEDGAANLVASNVIVHNMSIGIDLGPLPGLPTVNDAGDTDTGGNGAQNFPVLVSATNNGAQIAIAWTLDSTPGDSFVVEFYGSAGPDPTTYGEGERSLGSTAVLVMPGTPPLSATSFVSTPNPPPNVLSAVAHNMTRRNTSEFAKYLALDSDGDGMGDGYEAVNFGGYASGSAGADPDSDGQSNLQEYRADTVPTNALSVFRADSLSMGGSTFMVTAPYSAERGYRVETATNLLLGSAAWTTRNSTLTHTGRTAHLYGSIATNAAAYRVIISLP